MSRRFSPSAKRRTAEEEVPAPLWGDVMLGEDEAEAFPPVGVDVLALELAEAEAARKAAELKAEREARIARLVKTSGSSRKAGKAPAAAAPAGGAGASGSTAAPPRGRTRGAPPKGGGGGSRFAALSVVDPDDVVVEAYVAPEAPWAGSAALAPVSVAAAPAAPVKVSLAALMEADEADSKVAAARREAEAAAARARAEAVAADLAAAGWRTAAGGRGAAGGAGAGGKGRGGGSSFARGGTGGGRKDVRRASEPTKPASKPTNLGRDLDAETVERLLDNSSIFTLYVGNLPRRSPAKAPKDWDEKRDGKWDPWYKLEQEVGDFFRSKTEMECRCPWVIAKGGAPAGALVEFDSPDDMRDFLAAHNRWVEGEAEGEGKWVSDLEWEGRVLRIEPAKANYKPL
jgi:hypothetical protein